MLRKNEKKKKKEHSETNLDPKQIPPSRHDISTVLVVILVECVNELPHEAVFGGDFALPILSK